MIRIPTDHDEIERLQEEVHELRLKVVHLEGENERLAEENSALNETISNLCDESSAMAERAHDTLFEMREERKVLRKLVLAYRALAQAVHEALQAWAVWVPASRKAAKIKEAQALVAREEISYAELIQAQEYNQKKNEGKQ